MCGGVFFRPSAPPSQSQGVACNGHPCIEKQEGRTTRRRRAYYEVTEGPNRAGPSSRRARLYYNKPVACLFLRETRAGSKRDPAGRAQKKARIERAKQLVSQRGIPGGSQPRPWHTCISLPPNILFFYSFLPIPGGNRTARAERVIFSSGVSIYFASK